MKAELYEDAMKDAHELPIEPLSTAVLRMSREFQRANGLKPANAVQSHEIQ